MKNQFPNALLIIFLVLAQPLSVLSENNLPILPIEDREKENIYTLLLNEVCQIALQNNFDIQLARYDAYIAQTKKKESDSLYDTIIDSQIQYHNNQRKQVSTILGSKVIDNDYHLGITKKLPTGTTVGVDMSNNRHWSNSAFISSNPSHDSSLTLNVKQELGKNFFGLEDRGDIKMTRLDIENTGFLSLDRIEAEMAAVEKAYWGLVLQNEKFKIAQEILRQARQLLDFNQEKIVDGLAEAPELLAAEANFENRMNEVTMTELELRTKVNILKFLLNIEDNQASMVPGDQFRILSDESQQLDLSLKKAFQFRRDYKRAQNDIKSKKLLISIKKNSLWPEINLEATLARNGLGDHFPKAVENISQEDNPDLLTVLKISFPLENNKAEANWDKAKLEHTQALINLKLLERMIVLSIDDRVRNCNILKELAISKEKIAELQLKKLQAEEKRFRTGRSETDTMIRYQEDTIQARWEAVEAKYLYSLALIDLRQAEGTFLDPYGIEEL